MSQSYVYDHSDFTTSSGVISGSKLTIEINDSSIAKTLDSITDNGTSEECTIVFEEALSSGEETTLDNIVANHDGQPPVYTPDEFEYWAKDPIVTDSVTGKQAKFSLMQALINRRELFNDSNNPVYKADHTPILGSSGWGEDHADRIDNFESIHSKIGWHEQEVLTALYPRPKDLLIYHGWLNSFNSGTHGWDNEKVAKELSKYGLLVFGAGLEDPSHGDYSNTVAIIDYIKSFNPATKIFGYVSVDQALQDFKDKVDDWDDLGVHGIFMDEAGYDYGKTRSEFNDRVDYVHGKTDAKLCFANAWNTDHILGTANDTSYPNTTYNSGLVESNLTTTDWILLESMPINTTVYTASTPDGYEPKADWAARGVKAQGLRTTYGVNFAACGIVDDGTTGGQDMFDFSFVAACMFAWEAHGISDTAYGASSAKGKWWTRPNVFEMGPLYNLNADVKEDSEDSDVYFRYVQCGKFNVDFSDSAQDSEIEKW